MVNPELTAREVMAHFECRTKSNLLAYSVAADEPHILSDLYRNYRLAALPVLEQSTGRKLIDFTELPGTFASRNLIDSRSTFIDEAQLEPLFNQNTHSPPNGVLSEDLLPMFLCPFDEIEPWHPTVLYFAAAAIEHATSLAILDVPDNVAVAALSLAASASGLVRSRTTPLMTVDEVDKALAKNPNYRAPGR
jgi:hypothetical protein